MGNETTKTGEKVTHGICYMCTHRCPQKIYAKNGKAVKIEMLNASAKAFCPRWKAQLDFVYHPERLKYPLKKVTECGETSFVKISWDEALDIVARNFQKIKSEHGPESVVFYVAYTKEPRPYYHRLVHAFGSPNYCTESSNCFSANWLAVALTYGEDYGYTYAQSATVEPETKCKLIWGTSVRNSHPQNWQQHVKAKKDGIKLIVVDPRRNEIASMADIHLQLRPGTDGALALGMINVIINENLHDKEFVEKWTLGFDEFKKIVQEYTPSKVEEITWVPADKIVAAARLYATTKPAKVGLSPTGSTHHNNGVQNHRAIALLPALTGNFEVPGGNRWPSEAITQSKITLHELVEQMPPGLGADRFPIWTKMYKEMESNVLADRIESGKPYPIKGLFGAGLNPMFFPNSNRFVKMAKKLDFIVVTDYFQTPGTQLADIVLPIASWLERPILATYFGGKTMYIDPAIEVIGECRPEFKIYAELARRLGFGAEFWDGDFEKCINHVLEPAKLTVKELREHPEGYNYPVAKREPRYYEKAGFKTSSGKIEIYSSILAKHGHNPLPVYKEPTESPVSRSDLVATYPLILTSGARSVYYTHSLFRNVSQLRNKVPEPLLEINPKDAKARGIKSGNKVVITSLRGSARMKATVTDIVMPGVVHAPHHWPGEANINVLVDDQVLDPLSGFAPHKSQLCQITKA